MRPRPRSEGRNARRACCRRWRRRATGSLRRGPPCTRTSPAAPRNTLGEHLVGCLAGYLALVLFGLTQRDPALAVGVDWQNVGAAALSLGLTSGAMVWCRVPHPPAGATTLIVSRGILRGPWQLGVLVFAVALLVVQGFVINRLAGIDYPIWTPRLGPTGGKRP